MMWSASSEILLVIVCLVFGRYDFGTAPFLNVIYARSSQPRVTHGWPGVSSHDAYHDAERAAVSLTGII